MGIPRTQKGQLMSFSELFFTEAFDGAGQRVEVEPAGLYATWDQRKIYLHYSGKKAMNAHCLLELPANPDDLRVIAQGFLNVADKIEKSRL
ncbi:hypothetical protein [Pseudomonas protegens]|uniref:hypothetical protein n=1 Tax=Pseudomonas protegens TaxID=380021 RepID=UPI00274FA76A|nr:hypothetical protein [Pseudomonas protegens]MDP9518794.1 hypothetical protein [Pseudomonas protegens]